MKLLLLLPLLLGVISPAIAHNEANGGDEGICTINGFKETCVNADYDD